MTTRKPWPTDKPIVEHSGMCDASTVRWVTVQNSYASYMRAVHPPCMCGAGLLALLGAAEVTE